MFKYSDNVLLALAVTSAIAGTSAFANAKPSQEVIEARQESQIWTTYALSPYLRANDLKVSVHEGKATLTGNVAEDVNKDLAKQIALGVDGIKSVDNKIEVVPNYMAPAKSADRSLRRSGRRCVDHFGGEVETGCGAVMPTASPRMSTPSRGKVKLTGTADSTEAKEAAGKLAMNTHGVNAVDNQLVVDTGKPGVAKTDGHRHGGRLDHHESEVDLHVLQQCGWFRHRGQHQWRHRQADRQDG